MRQASPNPFLLFPRDVGPDGCVVCTEPPAPCNCQANEICELSLRTCAQCPANSCRPNGSGGDGGGISTGALAGAIVGVILLLSVVIAGALFWRRRARAQKALEERLAAEGTLGYDAKGRPISITTRSTGSGPKPPSAGARQSTLPSPRAEKSPNPTQNTFPSSALPSADVRIHANGSSSTIHLGGGESTRGYASSTGGTIGHVGINEHNPFSDTASVSTVGTNVIPIAFVPPMLNPVPSSPPAGSTASGSTSTPARPARAPDLSLRLPPHLAAVAGADNGAELVAPKTPYAARSTRSGVSGVSSRASTISSASSVLYDTPIVTSAKVGRQVLGVMRAEVVPIPSPNSPNQSMLSAPSRARPSVRSPLAGIGFIPEDIEMEAAEIVPLPSSPSTSVKSNPFDDSKSLARRSTLTVGSTTTFGIKGGGDPANYPLPPSAPSTAHSEIPPPPYTSDAGHDIYSDAKTPRPSVSREVDDDARSRRSVASMASGFSRTDSILAAFPILPPTPSTPGSFQSMASSRPYPSSGHGYTQSQATINMSHTSTPIEEVPEENDILRPPVMPAARGSSGSPNPGRRTLGLSTMSSASLSSNTSSGLDAFPFHFGSATGDSSDTPSTPRGSIVPTPDNRTPTSTPRGVPADRASLDTIALSRDLEAYPLAYDR